MDSALSLPTKEFVFGAPVLCSWSIAAPILKALLPNDTLPAVSVVLAIDAQLKYEYPLVPERTKASMIQLFVG